MRARTAIITAAGLAVLLLGTAVKVGHWMMHYRAPCTQPCRDLGRVIEPGGDPSRLHACIPQCAPFKLDLQLADKRVPLGRWHRLWYKITLTNVSCYDLSRIRAVPYFENDLTGDLGLQVLDPEGNEVERGDFPAWTGSETSYRKRSEYGEVIPYSNEPGALKKFLSNSGLRIDDYGNVVLHPGKSMTTSQSVLDPHVVTLVDVPDDRMWGIARAHVPVSVKGLPPAIPGYRELGPYRFKKAGRYTVRAVYDATIGAAPVYPYASRIPPMLRELLFFFRLAQGPEFHPVIRESEDYHIRIESPVVEFEVRR